MNYYENDLTYWGWFLQYISYRGFGKSIRGTEIAAITKSHSCILSWEVFPYSPHIGWPPQQKSVPPSFNGKLIIVVIMEGALGLL